MKLIDLLLVLLLAITALWVPVSGYMIYSQYEEVETQREVLIATLVNVGELKEQIDLNEAALIEMINYTFAGESKEEDTGI